MANRWHPDRDVPGSAMFVDSDGNFVGKAVAAATGSLRRMAGAGGSTFVVYIPPTTDPAITGAIWNNGGTLAISA